MSILLSAFVAMLLIDPEPSEKKDLDAIQGTWSVASMENEGRKQPRNPLFPVKLIFEKDEVLAQAGRRQPETQGTVKLDPKQTPKHYDFKTLGGVVVPGIYELDGDAFKVCLGSPGDRPSTFATQPGDRRTLIVYKREKPPQK
ncbi:TIGR03067 domain-containing protein [Paludisphaera rhizosphaerae]|uniref:TIGR03067 domain-containing protein n=1 Tax=Paludisphaera rhizosphaerae TaxID=2711216 RepID=UPI0013ECF969|nr:TIGR03067 domain-containing protein [Paludisphaera rhizosphaerae]